MNLTLFAIVSLNTEYYSSDPCRRSLHLIGHYSKTWRLTKSGLWWRSGNPFQTFLSCISALTLALEVTYIAPCAPEHISTRAFEKKAGHFLRFALNGTRRQHGDRTANSPHRDPVHHIDFGLDLPLVDSSARRSQAWQGLRLFEKRSIAGS